MLPSFCFKLMFIAAGANLVVIENEFSLTTDKVTF